MPEFRSDYIVTDMKKDVVLAWGGGVPLAEYTPGKNRMMEHVLYIDGEVGTGTFYSECVWFLSQDKVHPDAMAKMMEAYKNLKPGTKVGPQPHIHPFDELFTFFGTNFDDPTDLGAEIEFVLEDQPVVFDKSCIVYIPAGMKHCPLVTKKQERSIFHFSMGFAPSYDHTVLDGKPGKYTGQDMKKFFVFNDKKNLQLPVHRNAIPKGFTSRVAHLDNEVLPGSNFFAETAWIWPEDRSGLKVQDVKFVDKHTHPFQEVIGFFGSDLEDIHNLHGEVELWVEGKKYVINKSFSATIPAGVEHGPLIVRNVKKPIFHYTAGPGKMYK